MNTERITVRSPLGEIVYSDSLDHFENGLLRLMGMERGSFEKWLAHSEQMQSEDLLARLKAGFGALKAADGIEGEHRGADERASGPGGSDGWVLHRAIAENPAYGVARSRDGTLGWLIKKVPDGRFVFESEPPAYEEEYFEGDREVAGGYGAYLRQAGWRLEKAHRQLGEICAVTGLKAGAVLDVGSGYGYFRKALEESGFEHAGIEVSAHARGVARELYGFDSFSGALEEYAEGWKEKYDLITMWDVIEHIPDPHRFLLQVGRCLKTGRFVALKTPNLICPEAELFGPYYHSFKREHLFYFTGASLSALAEATGFEVVTMRSLSHLLQGFVGARTTRAWEEEMRGADLFCILGKGREQP